MSNHPFIYGIDFCFNAANPGNKDDEGHYTLGYGFIQRSSESSAWSKVDGPIEEMNKNNSFGFQFFDLSETVGTLDFVSIDFRPAADQPVPAPHTSPFSSNDENELRDGFRLTKSGAEGSCGCGDGTTTPTGNFFSVGEFVLKNTGKYEVTVEIQITNSNNEKMNFKCDPEMIVKT